VLEVRDQIYQGTERIGDTVLRGEKKDKAPGQWSKKKQQLRKRRDRDREKETRLVNRRGPCFLVTLIGDDLRPD